MISIDGVETEASGLIRIVRMENLADTSVLDPIITGLIIINAFFFLYINVVRKSKINSYVN